MIDVLNDIELILILMSVRKCWICVFYKYGDVIYDFKYIYFSVEKMEIYYVFIYLVD